MSSAAAPSAHVCTPRAPVLSSDRTYRYYGPDREAAYGLRPVESVGSVVYIARHSACPTATLHMQLTHSAGAPIKAHVHMTSTELRELAARLLDAAHDIDRSMP